MDWADLTVESLRLCLYPAPLRSAVVASSSNKRWNHILSEWPELWRALASGCGGGWCNSKTKQRLNLQGPRAWRVEGARQSARSKRRAAGELKGVDPLLMAPEYRDDEQQEEDDVRYTLDVWRHPVAFQPDDPLAIALHNGSFHIAAVRFQLRCWLTGPYESSPHWPELSVHDRTDLVLKAEPVLVLSKPMKAWRGLFELGETSFGSLACGSRHSTLEQSDPTGCDECCFPEDALVSTTSAEVSPAFDLGMPGSAHPHTGLPSKSPN